MNHLCSSVTRVAANNRCSMINSLTLLLLLLQALLSLVSADFGYNGPHGPEHWGESYHSCVGKHQSPINIEEHIVRDVELPDLIFRGFDLPRKAMMINNGHTAMIHWTNDSDKAYMSGGPLNGSYAFEQLHFHWGENDWEGSEDLINNHSFAMELHAVFYKLDYQSFTEALRYPDGLAVVAFFFEVSPSQETVASFDQGNESNPAFEPLVNGMPKIEEVGAEIELAATLRLEHLLIPNVGAKDRMRNYFTYNGSLTTPPCTEVVTWIDFKDPLYLSHAQLEAFRNIRTPEGHKLTHNFRPVQPLSDRLVLHNLVKRASVEREENRAVKRDYGAKQSSAGSMRFDWFTMMMTIICCLIARKIDT